MASQSSRFEKIGLGLAQLFVVAHKDGIRMAQSSFIELPTIMENCTAGKNFLGPKIQAIRQASLTFKETNATLRQLPGSEEGVDCAEIGVDFNWHHLFSGHFGTSSIR